MMTETPQPERLAAHYIAPARLTAAARHELRAEALQALEQAARAGASAVVIDLGDTVEIDASGMGVLILIQKRARERGMRTALVRVPRDITRLLDATRLYPLFDLEPLRGDPQLP